MNQKEAFFFSALFLAIFLLLLLWLPFISTIFLAMIIASVLYPAYEKALKYLKGNKTVSASVVVIVFVVAVLIPLFVIGIVVAGEASDIIGNIPIYINNPPDVIKKLISFSNEYLRIPEKAIRKELLTQATNIQAFILKTSTYFMSGTIKVAANILVFIMALFCFLRDGRVLIEMLRNVVPLNNTQRMYILDRLNNVSRAVVRGMLLNALIVAIISSPGFIITGLSVPLWSMAVAIGILIPVIGSLTVWTSAVVVLLITAGVKSAVFIACYGILIIGLCDNIIGPYLMKGSQKIGQIWILFSILGGINLFGVSGILIGPMILALAIAFVDVYKLELEGSI